jgi:hypothetical protein
VLMLFTCAVPSKYLYLVIVVGIVGCCWIWLYCCWDLVVLLLGFG